MPHARLSCPPASGALSPPLAGPCFSPSDFLGVSVGEVQPGRL
jgi:hypothetical protein